MQVIECTHLAVLEVADVVVARVARRLRRRRVLATVAVASAFARRRTVYLDVGQLAVVVVDRVASARRDLVLLVLVLVMYKQGVLNEKREIAVRCRQQLVTSSTATPKQPKQRAESEE